MTEPVFWDTHGFFALLSSDDTDHARAKKVINELKHRKTRSVTSDWVVGETCTLLMVRKKSHIITGFLQSLRTSFAITLLHIDMERFRAAEKYLLKHLDQGFSFTDCTSFVLMKELKLKQAVSADTHFEVAGFTILL